MRAALGIPGDAPLLGYVGRLDAMKDIPTLCAGVAEAARHVPGLRAVFCGAGLEEGNAEMRSLLAAHGLTETVRLLGARDDVPALMAGFDCLALSSCSEGFPNVLGEAMASGVPCVTTDVGDAALVVGETGRVVPRGDTEALGRAVAEVLGLPPEDRITSYNVCYTKLLRMPRGICPLRFAMCLAIAGAACGACGSDGA